MCQYVTTILFWKDFSSDLFNKTSGIYDNVCEFHIPKPLLKLSFCIRNHSKHSLRTVWSINLQAEQVKHPAIRVNIRSPYSPPDFSHFRIVGGKSRGIILLGNGNCHSGTAIEAQEMEP